MSPLQSDQLTGRLLPVVRSAVRSAGFELESLDVHSAGRRRLVRVVADVADVGDTVDPAGGAAADLDLDAVAELSRTVAAALDAHDELLGGPYTLEVSSPGIDRPLTRPGHWRRSRLRQVRIRRRDGSELVGRLGPCDATAAVVLVDGRLHTVRYADVDHAAVEVEFRQPPPEELSVVSGAAATAALTTTADADHDNAAKEEIR